MKTGEKTIPKHGGGEPRIPEALDRLIELYTAIDKSDEAKKWRAGRVIPGCVKYNRSLTVAARIRGFPAVVLPALPADAERGVAPDL